MPFVLAILLPGLNIVSNHADILGLPWKAIVTQYATSSIFLLAMWYSNQYLLKEKNPVVRYFGVYGSLFLGNAFLILILLFLDYFIVTSGLKIDDNYVAVSFRLAILAFLLVMIQRVFKTIRDREALKRQNLSLQTENLKSQMETLKQQINPHFLFNSLNTLLDFIEEDQEKAVEFVRSFSNLYRVVLQSSQRDFVLLEDELKFLHDYWKLLKMRFNGAVDLQIDSKLETTNYLIPPLSFQLLIENAVKHNQATSEKPLTIEIFRSDNSIVIQNNLIPKAYKEKGEGVGLMNLQKRFTLLYKPIQYGIEGNMYKVILPLKSV